MESTVNLQEPFSYSIWPIIAAAVILLLLIAALVIIKLVHREKKPKTEPVVKEPFNLEKIRKKHLGRLAGLRTSVENDSVNLREAYQLLSSITRSFINAVTGIKVQNYTLAEIRKLQMPFLAELVEECYPPEFARMSVGDIKESIDRAERVIRGWN